MKSWRWISALGLLAAMPAMALTPPWDDAELRAAADLIVIGTIGPHIECAEKPEQYGIATLRHYVASLHVQKVLKGRHTGKQPLTYRFTYYQYPKGGTGDQGAVVSPGTVGKFFLQRLKEEGHVRALHWSAVQVIEEGAGSLPPCR